MKKILCLALCLGMPLFVKAQQDTVAYERDITLEEAIALARVQSVDAAVALNELKTAYWEYRTFRANLLPEVNFTGTLPTAPTPLSATTTWDCRASSPSTRTSG